MSLIAARNIVAAVALLFTGATASAEVVLSPAEMREVASQAVLQGRPDVAYDLAGALLQRDANDIDAQLIRSRAARDLGRYDTALEHARRAWDLADFDRARYAAALAQAQALASAGNNTRAQWWLRRAAQIAPNDQLKTRAARDFQYVRAQNRWSTYLSFSISPSSNINNGSRNETSELFDLPLDFQLQGEARALSGVEISTGLSTRYRLQQSSTRRTDLFFSAQHRSYVLSDDAKEIAPDADGSDFATSSAAIGVQQLFQLSETGTHLGWNARVGKVTFGGDDLLRYSRLGTEYRTVVGESGLLNLSLSHEAQDGLNGRDDASIWTGAVGYGHRLENGNRISLSATLIESESDADYLDYTKREIGVRYSLSQPIGRALWDFGVTVSDKTHEVSNLTSDGREERSVEASITAALPDFDFYGFIPTVTLKAERTDANLDLYETENFGIRLGIRSAF
ncbi:tetratricopeptide repeat protein [Marivita hallyeonensis]|nr:hypothetical protein [Marivita hallyeonensis]